MASAMRPSVASALETANRLSPVPGMPSLERETVWALSVTASSSEPVPLMDQTAGSLSPTADQDPSAATEKENYALEAVPSPIM